VCTNGREANFVVRFASDFSHYRRLRSELQEFAVQLRQVIHGDAERLASAYALD
jgi:hypothetical protein